MTPGSLALDYALATPITEEHGLKGRLVLLDLVRRYLVDVARISVSDAAHEDWRVHEPLLGGSPLLLIPARSSLGDVLSVRAVDLSDIGECLREGRPLSVGRRVEGALGTRLPWGDVPTPFEVGCLEGPRLVVTRDPFHALVMRRMGLRATALADPCGTIGSEEGRRALLRVGARTRPASLHDDLVILDDGTSVAPEERDGLGEFYDTVWEAPEADRLFYDLVDEVESEAQQTGTSAAELFMANVTSSSEWAPTYSFVRALSSILPSSSTAPGPPGQYQGARGVRNVREPLALVRMSEIPAMEPHGTEWLVEGFVAAGAITELQGIPKAGKTTFALPMAAAVAKGGRFLGRKCEQAPVVYVSEQTRATLMDSLRRASRDVEGVFDVPDLHVLTVERLFGRTWDEVLPFLLSECRALGAGLVVFDTLGQVTMLQGEAEASDGGGARALFRSLKQFNFDGVAVLAVRHSRKEGGGIVETGLGSVTVSGEADHIVRLRNVEGDPENVRRIDSVGRMSDPLDISVERTPKGWKERPRKAEAAGPRPAGKEAGGPRGFILEALRKAGAAGLTVEAFVGQANASGRSGLGENTLRAALKELVDDGTISATKGKRGRLTYRAL